MAGMRAQFFATKSIDRLRAEAEAGHGMRRSLSALDLTLLGIGAIMGTGIFVITGQAAAMHAGPAVILSFLIAGSVATMAALCYSEMAAMIPIAGSAYTYAYAALGELTAFIIGWDLILAYAVSAAMVSVGWSGYMVAFIQHLSGWAVPERYCTAPLAWDGASQSMVATGAVANVPAMLIILGLSAMLVVGVRESARLNASIVFIKIGVVLIFLAATCRYIQPSNWVPFLPKNTGSFGKFGYSGVLQAATMVFVSYIGFDAVSVAAQEAHRPQRDVPIGILSALGICTFLYIAVALVLTGVVPYAELAVPYPIARGIEVTGILWLTTLVDIGAIAGLTSVILVMLMAQPRILMVMARDGLLPQQMARVHPRFGTPHLTTAVSGVVVSLAGGFFSVDVLGEMVSVGTLFAFVLVSLGVMVLRLRRPELARPFRVPGGAFLIPLTSAGVCASLMYTATGHGLARLSLWLILGLGLYLVHFRKHSRLRLATEAGGVG